MSTGKPRLYGERYLRSPRSDRLAQFITEELPFLDFADTLRWYRTVLPAMDNTDRALLGCNDRYFLLTALLGRSDALHPWLFNRCREVEAAPDGYLDLWARYHYKDLDVKTQVLTTKGWKSHGDLKPEDWVFSPSGEPVRVVATKHFTDSACYRVTFDNGISFVCGAGHLWSVEVSSRKRVPGTWTGAEAGSRRLGRVNRVVETSELAALRGTYRPCVKVTHPLYGRTLKLPIDPYVLGAWLGDGSSGEGRICGVDADVFDEIENRGYKLSASHCPQRAPFLTVTVYGLAASLRRLGLLQNKHIPLQYLLASAKQRRELLWGIVDTDGSVSTGRNGCVTIAMKRREFADQVRTLANSLGYKARVTPARTTNSWHVTFQVSANDPLPPCLLRRKLLRLQNIPRRLGSQAWRVVSVEPVETTPTNCIQVDSADGMYLVGRELVPTHNSTICTFAGIIQEIIRDPEITVCILSCTRDIARAFLVQIQQELENNEDLKQIYPDVLWADPKKEASRWSRETGLVVKRKSNPKEATVEAYGLIDGQPTSRHYKVLNYDDPVTQDLVGNPEMIKKVTERLELSDNLGTHGETRKRLQGTRYSFADTYGVMLERGTFKARIYPATDDGLLDGVPVLMTQQRWDEVKDAQRSTVSAQMLLNPVAGNEAIFRVEWLKSYDVRPTILNVYIMVDPSKGRGKRSDRTAIAVVGVDVAGNRYLLDGVRHRMPLSERWGHLKRLYLKWSAATGVQVVIVGYERYGAQTEDEVIREWQQRDGLAFELVELNWPREGAHSKKDRVSRLEPDMRRGRFYLPSTVYFPDKNGEGGLATWSIRDGKVHYEPYRGPSKQQVTCEKTGQSYRIIKAVKNVDEDRNVYDLTRAFIEEMVFFPFSPKDDLIDAVSRLYDLEPKPAVQFESQHAEAPVYADS